MIHCRRNLFRDSSVIIILYLLRFSFGGFIVDVFSNKRFLLLLLFIIIKVSFGNQGSENESNYLR
jgi:hypothetical protein